MKIGLLQTEVYIPDSHSIKDKRTRISKLKWGLRKRFNVSVLELGDRDKWQVELLGILFLGRRSNYVDKTFNDILTYVKKVPNLQLIDYNIQVM